MENSETDYRMQFERLLKEYKELSERFYRLQQLLKELEENRVKALYS